MSLFTVNEFGVISVDTSEVLADFQEAYKGALGANLNLNTGSPQGQLIANDVKNVTYVQEQMILMANSFSVFYATGQALDAAAGFWGYTRKQGTPTVVTATLTGAAGTIIPAGSLASDGTNQYQLLNTLTIPASGNINGQFQGTKAGAIPCLAGSLTTIVSVVQGWDSVSNASDGVVGWETENDNVFRQRITANWLNIRATSILGAIIDNIAQLDGVISVVGRENDTKVEQTIDGVLMKPNSIFLSVLGGMDSDIAKVLTVKKTLGAATNGNTQVTIYDTAVEFPYTYNIFRPNVQDIKVQIEYSANYDTPADVETKIVNTIMSYIAKNPFMIGQAISGNDLSMALTGFPFADILSVKVAKASDADYSDYITTTIEQIAVLSQANVNVVRV